MSYLKSISKFVRGSRGFTLSELAVVLVVVGVLAAVAVPSYLGSRNNSFDKAAQGSIDVVLRAAKIHYQTYGDFSEGSTAQCGDSALLAADLQKLEPGIDIVAGTSVSNNPRVVSVQAVRTWNSGNESLGCQAIYAVALSASGSCWAARYTVEGKYLAAGSVSPIVLAEETNTNNSEIVPLANTPVNALAYGALKPETSGANGLNVNGLAGVAAACKAATQSTGSAAEVDSYIAPTQFYSSWRDVAAAVAAATTTTTTAATTTTTAATTTTTTAATTTTTTAATTTTTTAPTSCATGATCIVGDTGPGGGIVFYVASGDFTSTGSDCNTSCRYLEAAPTDQSTESWWTKEVYSCYAEGFNFPEANCWLYSIYPNSADQSASRTASTSIGMGMSNTNRIYARMAAGSVNTSEYAAGVAYAYTNNGKTDWHLPSQSELNQMCKWQRGRPWTSNATVCSGGTLNSGRNASNFVDNWYWSSSEWSRDSALDQDFSTGEQVSTIKGYGDRVRAVRAFG